MRKQHIAVQKLLYETYAEHTAKVSTDERQFRVGIHFHGVDRVWDRTFQLIPNEASDRIAYLLNNEDTYDAMLDVADPEKPFHLWDIEKELVYVLGYGYDEIAFPNEDCFFCITVNKATYGDFYRVTAGESVIVVDGSKYVCTNPSCVSYDKIKKARG